MWTLTPGEVVEPDLKSHNLTSTAANLVARSATRVAEVTAVEVQLWTSSPVQGRLLELKSTSSSMSGATDRETPNLVLTRTRLGIDRRGVNVIFEDNVARQVFLAGGCNFSIVLHNV